MGAHTLSEDEMSEHYHLSGTQTWLEGEYWQGGLHDVCSWEAYGKIISRNSSTNSVGDSLSHTHSISNISMSSSQNLPLYYSLSYIMRIM